MHKTHVMSFVLIYAYTSGTGRVRIIPAPAPKHLLDTHPNLFNNQFVIDIGKIY